MTWADAIAISEKQNKQDDMWEWIEAYLDYHD